MRQKRAKAYKKLMALYHLSFGFREPYQVLVDSEMCSTSASLKLELVKQFASVLQGNVKPSEPLPRVLLPEVHLTLLGAVDLAKSFERRKCNHREAIPGDECIASVVGDTNKHRYVIASQSQAMRARLRGVPGVPMVHLNRTVLVLEPPSDTTIGAKRQAEENALLPSAPERSQIATDGTVEAPKRQRKGPKGPNPLSVKKKKVRADEIGRATAGIKRKLEEARDSHPGGGDTLNDKPKRKRRKKDKVTLSTTNDPD